ncbi:peptidoglycan DD-metalloendopeptidase family protein [Pedobacter nyackensis]|uniref:peptidoglycan DD-metalloendopeptidase family protein n=1 Tax=Pedobacter nyackensis TaxID=475255 RepID=UPI00292F207A|nr:peptidoglycan DD-metalloendopeptidase family protein [Pedobacter nyackensis]
MKKLTFTLLFTLIFTGITLAQSESDASKYTMTKFQMFYNSGQPDSIFNLFSPESKTALPLDKTKAFLTHLKNNFGLIKQTHFVNYQDQFAVYKTDMEKETILLSLRTAPNKAITGVYAKPYEVPQVQKPNTTKMQLPFKGEWTVFWGGDTKEQNYHVVAKMQKNAFDMIITNAEGKSYKTDGKKNEDYYAFGQNLTAPCDAEVVFAVDGVKDNTPGVMNTLLTLGNTVLLKTQNNEYILFAHFKQGTVKVKQGEKVKTGQLLGQCGNSGNSSEAHLHFHIQDVEDFNQATGIKCFFDKVKVNGVVKSDYSPVKGDKISIPLK